jgi:hypothetical protein
MTSGPSGSPTYGNVYTQVLEYVVSSELDFDRPGLNEPVSAQ